MSNHNVIDECSNCGASLANGPIYADDDYNPLCEDCYFELEENQDDDD